MNKKYATTPDIEALFAVPQVRSFDPSPSGEMVSFVTNSTGQWQLYVASILNDESLGSARQITNDQNGTIASRFSPDSKSILHPRDFQGDENYDLFLTGVEEGGITRNLTPDTSFAIYPSATISKDGRKVAYVSNETREFATYVLHLDETRKKVRISNHKFSDTYAVFSPDSKSIGFTSLVSGQDSALFVASPDQDDQDNYKITRLEDKRNGELIEANEPEWSPDGKKIAFASASKGSYDIGIWDIETEEVKWLTNSDHEYYEPVFSHNGKELAYTLNSGGDVRLVVHDFTTEDSQVVEFRHGIVQSPKFSSDDRSIFFLFSGPKNPLDIWRYEISSGKPIQLTKSLPENIDISGFVDGGREVYYTSKKDALKVPSLLTLPKNNTAARARKAVVLIHGGPTSQALISWNPFLQILVAHGIVVLEPNYRGSTGYGRKFKEANRFVMGDLDLADCASGFDYLVEEGIADPRKIVVTGGSFGGYLTMCALSKYPDRWVCGSALVPFLNWFTEIENERDDLRFWDMQNMGDPKKDIERLRNASPIFFLDKVRAPVQLIAGAHDPRCPAEESEQARDELQKLGKPVDFKIYEDEGHGFRKTANRVDAYKRCFSFILKYLDS